MHSTIFTTSKLTLLALLTSTLTTSSPILEDHALFKRAPLTMGLAKTFCALAGTTLTSTGATSLTGNGGVWPGSAITGFPPATCSGSLSYAGTAAQNGEAACLTAYNAGWAKLSSAVALASPNLGGITLTPGVYKFPTSGATLSGTLTLNGAGNPNGQYIFLISTTFASAANSAIALINGAKACNVYIINGSSSTIGGASSLKGNIISYTSIAASEAASNKGTWCALNGAVTLINNSLTSQNSCTSV